jgi:hypothetical protein
MIKKQKVNHKIVLIPFTILKIFYEKFAITINVFYNTHNVRIVQDLSFRILQSEISVWNSFCVNRSQNENENENFRCSGDICCTCLKRLNAFRAICGEEKKG